MANELMLGTHSGKRFPLDPRTKILLTLTISTVSLMGGSYGIMGIVRLVLAAIPCLLLLASRRFRAATIYTGVFTVSYLT